MVFVSGNVIKVPESPLYSDLSSYFMAHCFINFVLIIDSL